VDTENQTDCSMANLALAASLDRCFFFSGTNEAARRVDNAWSSVCTAEGYASALSFVPAEVAQSSHSVVSPRRACATYMLCTVIVSSLRSRPRSRRELRLHTVLCAARNHTCLRKAASGSPRHAPSGARGARRQLRVGRSKRRHGRSRSQDWN